MSATAAPANGEGGEKKRQERKKDETPIEELYDLSQPIPHVSVLSDCRVPSSHPVQVERPNKNEHEKSLKVITDAVDAIKNDRQKLQAKIDKAMEDPESKSSIAALRTKFNELRNKKNGLIDEKKAMRAQLDSIKGQTDKLVKDKKDAKSTLRFGSLEEIEKELDALKRKQETTTMSLGEEKRLIKEMDALMASKSMVAQLKDKNGALDSAKEQRKAVSLQISSKDKEIDAVSKEVSGIKEELDSFNAKSSEKRAAIDELFKERDELKKKIAEKLKEKDAIRDGYREKNNKWYNYTRAIRAQKQMQYEEEKKKREEEKAAYLAELEAEEAKKIPYEAEQALCEFLADYLERTYLDKKEDSKEEAKNDIVAVKDDPFAGIVAVNKKNEKTEYFGKGKGKKKRTRQSKKQGSGAGPFTLSVDTFDQFGLISLTPPTSIEQVEGKVKELREKKEWYKNQPRGSVPTALEIRKANEKAAAKLRQSTQKATADNSKQKGKAGFSLSNDDFTPLVASGASSAAASTWGKANP